MFPTVISNSNSTGGAPCVASYMCTSEVKFAGGSLTFANHHEPSISEAEGACPDENKTKTDSSPKGLTYTSLFHM